MKEFQAELKALLEKYNAKIVLYNEENFLFLNLHVGDTKIIVDSGYRDLEITPQNL